MRHPMTPAHPPFALRYRRAHTERLEASIRAADPVLSLSKGQPERVAVNLGEELA